MQKNQRDYQDDFSLKLWFFCALIMVPTFMSCKHKKSISDTEISVNDSKLQALRDDEYILALKQNQVFPENFGIDPEDYLMNFQGTHNVSYSFLTCRINKATAIKNRVYRRKGSYPEGSPPYHPMGYIIDESSCVPAYTDMYGVSFRMVPMPVEEFQQEQDLLTVEIMQYLKHAKDKQDFLFHVAAFGTGASFNIFSEPVRKSFTTLVPAAQKKPWLMFGGLVGISAAPTQYEVYDQLIEMSIEDIATDFAKVRLEKQGQKVEGANGDEQHVALKPTVFTKIHDYGTTAAKVGAKTLPYVASGTAGFFASRLMVTAATRVGGPRAALFGQLIVPFMSSMVIHRSHSKNIPRKMLDLYEDIMTVNDPTNFANEPFRAKKLGKGEVARVGPLLAMVLTLAGWGHKQTFYQFCLPAKEAGGDPVCEVIPHNLE